MTRQTEACTDLIGECVVFLFRNFCIGQAGITEDPATWPSLAGSLTLKGLDGPPTDPNGALYVLDQGSRVHGFSFEPGVTEPGTEFGWEVCEVDGCEYLAVKTCSLVANIDSDGQGRALSPEGTRYCANLRVGGSTVNITSTFEIDAAIDYSAELVCDCIPIGVLVVDGDVQAAAGSDAFSERVCNTDCIIDLRTEFQTAIDDAAAVDAGLQAQIDTNTGDLADHETRLEALEGIEYVTGVSVGPPDGDGNVEIFYDTNQNSGLSAGVVPEPADTYITGIAPVTVTNPDGSMTTTFTATLSDGSTFDFTYDHTPSDTLSGFDIDPATGIVTITLTAPDGTTSTLTDTLPPQTVDTNTTNSTFTWDPATGDLVITDSEGNPLSVTIQQADVADNGNGTATFTDANSDTCIVPTSIPKEFCSGADIAKGTEYQPLTKQWIEDNSALYMRRAEAFPDDTCPPVEPTLCPEIPRFTFDPDGRPWFWNGGAWIVYQADEFDSNGTSNPATNVAAFLNGNPAVGDFFEIEVCHVPYVNASSCRTASCIPGFSSNGLTAFGITPDWRIRTELSTSIDGGATYIQGPSLYVDTRGMTANTIQSSGTFEVESANDNVPPGGSSNVICTRIRVIVEVPGTSVANANVTNTLATQTCHLN